MPTSVDSVEAVQPNSRVARSISPPLDEPLEIERVDGAGAGGRDDDDLRSVERLGHLETDHVRRAGGLQSRVFEARALGLGERDLEIPFGDALPVVEIGVGLDLADLGAAAFDLDVDRRLALGERAVLLGL